MVDFQAPRIRAKDPITTKDGTPTNAFVRFWDTFCKTLESVFRRQDQADADLQAQIDRLNRVLAGEEPFDAVNVGGNIVAEDGRLANGIVQTATIASEAVTRASAAYTSGDVSLSQNNPSETILQTVVVTAISGESVILTGVASYTGAQAPLGVAAQIDLYLYRGATQLSPTNRILSVQLPSNQFLLSAGTSSISFIDTPGVGTFTYTLRGRVFSSGNFLTDISQRFLSALGTKR